MQEYYTAIDDGIAKYVNYIGYKASEEFFHSIINSIGSHCGDFGFDEVKKTKNGIT